MPSVMDVPELMEYAATHDLTIETIERPQIHRVRPGFWRTLAHKLTAHLPPTQGDRHAPSVSAHRPFETSADLLARQYPMLYLRALSGV